MSKKIIEKARNSTADDQSVMSYFMQEATLSVSRKILARAGTCEVRHTGWHDFRHTFASRLAQNGVSLYKICKWLGHADFKTTQIYAHFAHIYDGDIEKLAIQKTEELINTP